MSFDRAVSGDRGGPYFPKNPPTRPDYVADNPDAWHGLEMSMTYRATEFTPAEAAAITGVSPDLQQKWRSRGYFMGGEGRKWFKWVDMELAHLALVGRVAQLVGPARAIEMCGPANAAGPCLTLGAEAAKAGDPAVADYFSDLPPRGRYAVFRESSPTTPWKNFELYDDLSTLPATGDALIVVDIFALAQEMAAKAPRPIATMVEVAD